MKSYLVLILFLQILCLRVAVAQEHQPDLLLDAESYLTSTGEIQNFNSTVNINALTPKRSPLDNFYQLNENMEWVEAPILPDAVKTYNFELVYATGSGVPKESAIPRSFPECLNCRPVDPEVVGRKLADLKKTLSLKADPNLIAKINLIKSQLDSKEARVCSAAVVAYDSAKRACGPVCTEEMIRDYTERSSSAYYNQLQILKLARNKLDESCMEGNAKSIPVGFNKKYIFERTGVLIMKSNFGDKEEEVFCGAGIISKNRIVTAKHCFFGQNGNENYKRHEAVKDARLVFKSLENPNRPILIESIITAENGQKRNLSNNDIPEDYLILSTKSSVPLTLAVPTPTGKSSRLDEALIVGWFKAANPNRYRTSEEVESAWEKKVRWSKQKCIVFDITNQCMIHTCSTEAVFSGAPVWTLSPQTPHPQISGVQSAHSNAVRGCGFQNGTPHHNSFNMASSGFLGE